MIFAEAAPVTQDVRMRKLKNTFAQIAESLLQKMMSRTQISKINSVPLAVH